MSPVLRPWSCRVSSHRYRTEKPVETITERLVIDTGSFTPCLNLHGAPAYQERWYFYAFWIELRYFITTAGTFVAFFDVEKPAGVLTEITVSPRLTGVNRLGIIEVPDGIVTGDSTVPTSGWLLFKLTVTETPARSSCTVISAASPLAGWR